MGMRLMLYQNKQDNINFHKEYINTFNINGKDELSLLNSIENMNFPGAIIPTKSNYYVCANSQKDWSILSSLVESFVGVSYSDFIGIKSKLNTGTMEEKYLISKNILFLSLISIPNDDISQNNALKAFQSLYNTYSYSNGRSIEISEYIDSVLENFITSLQIKDINTAQQIISNIKKENRLDALNIKFMQIELSYSINDWNAIVNDNLITHIINSRKPLKIRLHIIEAFYYEYLESAIDDSSLMSTYKSNVRGMISSLLFKCPVNASIPVKKMYLIAYLNDDIEYKEIRRIIDGKTDEFFKEEFQSSLSTKLKVDASIRLDASVSDDNFISARAAVIDDNNTNSIESQFLVSSKAQKLDEKEKLELLTDNLTIKNTYLPKDWLEWIALLSNEGFKESLLIAEKGLEEWDIDAFTNDPTNVNNLSKQILSIDEQFSLSRFIIALPLFIESLKRNQQYPNPLCFEIYSSILEVISIYEVQDQKTLILSQDIFESILMISPKSSDYDNIIQVVEIIMQRINGKHYINWLIDFAEVLISYNASNIESRNKLLELILMQIYEQKDWIEQYQLNFLIKLLSIIDLSTLFENLFVDEVKEDDDKFEKYIGKTIGIYTLSESAGKNAKEYLENQIQDVRIILNHDKAATTALRHIAEASDYMVIVTQSAKHAATGEIQKIRRQNNKEVLFPLGKGSSSIINCLLLK